ncbi:MAG TPA: PAS domain-containing protein, partial [Ktedonobacteraceae bacterium]|nr:PAS domain-containing protein [Ktedonobacteraceae bacterium]
AGSGMERNYMELDIRTAPTTASQVSPLLKIQDIHDARERLFLAVQGADDGLLDWNIASGEVYFSPRWKEMLGYTEADIPPCLEEWVKRIHPSDRSYVLTMLQRHLDGDTSLYRLEHRLRHKDGSYRWVLARGASLRDANGKAYRLAGWHVDITESKQAAEERLEEHVENRTRELSLLLKVSHAVASTLELKPLLNTILAQLKIVVEYTGAALLIMQEDHPILLNYQGPLSLPQVERLLKLFDHNPKYKELYQQCEAILGDDLCTDTPFDRAYIEQVDEGVPQDKSVLRQFRSWMTVPLIVHDRTIGTLILNHSRAHFYTRQHARLAFAVASQAAVALENAYLYEQAQALAVLQERQNLARELHDSISQVFYGINLGAHCAREALETNPHEALEPLEHIIMHTETGQAEMRALLFELRSESLEIEGLVAALQKQVMVLRTRYRMSVKVFLEDEPGVSIDRKHALYRIAQEAIHNVVKHAQASTVTLRLACDGRDVVLEVQDDGRGFDTTSSFPGHLGLRSMQERAVRLYGTLTLESTPGVGTSVMARIPLQQSEV